MEAEDNKGLDRLIKNLVSEAGTEEVSDQFTDSVMQKIGVAKKRKYIYQPPINTTTWGVLALVIAVVCLFLLTRQWDTSSAIVHIPFLNQITDLKLAELYSKLDLKLKDNIALHPSIGYTLLMLSFFMYIQILLLRRKFG